MLYRPYSLNLHNTQSILPSPNPPNPPHRPTTVPPAGWWLHKPANIMESTQVNTLILAVTQLATWHVFVGRQARALLGGHSDHMLFSWPPHTRFLLSRILFPPPSYSTGCLGASVDYFGFPSFSKPHLVSKHPCRSPDPEFPLS